MQGWGSSIDLGPERVQTRTLRNAQLPGWPMAELRGAGQSPRVIAALPQPHPPDMENLLLDAFYTLGGEDLFLPFLPHSNILDGASLEPVKHVKRFKEKFWK